MNVAHSTALHVQLSIKKVPFSASFVQKSTVCYRCNNISITEGQNQSKIPREAYISMSKPQGFLNFLHI